jgi:hypothetical protein
MELMNDISKDFYIEDGEEKTIFPIAIPRRHKRMYQWLRETYPGSPIIERIREAIVKELESINAGAPKQFQDAS